MGKTNYNLKNITEDDYEFIYQVKKNAYKKYVEANWGLWDENAQREYFKNFIDTYKDNTFIIQLEGKNIGFYNGEILENGNYEVGNICIIPEYQGKGLGTQILKDILEKYKDYGIEIQYFKQNPVGKLYERLGFMPNGETAFHYQMIKPIKKFNVILKSDNIDYVELSKDLIDDYLEMVNNPDIAKMITKKVRVFTYEQELEWVKEKLDENACIFSMIEKITSEYIGNIEIMNINNNIGEIGICITASKQDKHYGTEAMKRIVEYGFNELNLDCLELNVYSTNTRAIHCYEKVGFVNVGVGKTENDIHMVLKK